MQPQTVEVDRYRDLVREFPDHDFDSHVPPDWLTKLKLERPGTNLHELGLRTRIVKRTMDIVFSLGAIVFLAPIALVVALLIKLSSPGPVVYRQVRVGLNRRRRSGKKRVSSDGESEMMDRRKTPAFGRPFTIFKFRTMVKDAEKDGARLTARDDPRITKVGRFLRRTRLDEILQFWNVLLGEMSLVGPRPERPEFVERLSKEIPSSPEFPGYLARLGLKPGITGLAQILNGYDDGIESVRRKVSFDLFYLQNICLRNDLKILLRTVKVVITGSGAR
jgi:lipopolysaccharide/colanic/teichoic acid biosynthesis glycosyltransferase